MPPKGKAATRGQKQIANENKDTLKFYLGIVAGTNIAFLAIQYLFFWESFTAFYVMLYCLTNAVYFGSYQFMASMARPTYDDSANLLDAGIDLNMDQGLAEHLKDLILLSAIILILSLISNYFWWFYLLAPGRAFYLLWVNILAPYIFSEEPEVNEKKQKKLERKMKRRQ